MPTARKEGTADRSPSHTDLSATGSRSSCDMWHSTDPRLESSTGWRAAHPPQDTLKPSLAYRSHRHVPCGSHEDLGRKKSQVSLRGAAIILLAHLKDKQGLAWLQIGWETTW